MEELREKAKSCIIMKKPVSKTGETNLNESEKLLNESIGKSGDSSATADKNSQEIAPNISNPKQEVSESIKKSNISESSEDKNLTRKKSKRSKSRHKDSKHNEIKRKSSKHRHSSSRRRKRHRRSSVSSSSSSSRSPSSSHERRHRKKRDRRHRRRRSSSSRSSGNKHHYSRSKKYHKRRKSSSSSSSSGSERRHKRRREKVIVDKRSHPYFSRNSKIRRDKLNKEKQERFWDGFQWVSKESLELASKDPTINLRNKDPHTVLGEHDEKHVTGKDLRRVVATNLPLDFGIDHEDLGNYIIIKCKENGDDVLFKSIFLNTEHNSGILECTEKFMTDLVVKLDGVQLLSNTLRFTKVADDKGFINGGNSDNLLEESAQLTAQAAALVSARIRSLQGKDSSSNLNLLGDSFFSASKPSRIIKVSNVFDRYSEMTGQNYEELYEDMEEEMIKYGQPKRIKIIRNGEEVIGGKCFSKEPYFNHFIGEIGSIFVEFETEKEATEAKDGLKGRIYDGREINVIFIDEQIYANELKLKDE